MNLGRDSVTVGMIGTGPHRVPIWPQGTIGSITHSGNYAAAAVGGSKRIRGIGIDTERIAGTEVFEEIAQEIGSGQEITQIARAFGLDRDSALTVAFSAKESLFKCLFPSVSVFFGFRDAKVVNADADKDA